MCVHQNNCSALTSPWFVIIWRLNQVVTNPTSVGHFRRHSLKWFVTAFLFRTSCVCAYVFVTYLCAATIYFNKVEQKTSNLSKVKFEITHGHFYHGCMDPDRGLTTGCVSPTRLSKETPWHRGANPVRRWCHRRGADSDPCFCLSVRVKECVVQRAVIRASWLQNCLSVTLKKAAISVSIFCS